MKEVERGLSTMLEGGEGERRKEEKSREEIMNELYS